MAVKAEPIVHVTPIDDVGSFILPDIHFLRSGAATNPHFFLEIEFQRNVSATREEQMLSVQQVEEIRGARQIDRQRPCSVSIVDKQFIAGLDIVRRQIDAPPARRDTDLRIRPLKKHVERLGLDLVPNLLRERGVTFVIAVVAVKAEAVVHIAPINDIRSAILPENRLHSLPVAFVLGRLVNQFREKDFLSVISEKLTNESPVEKILLGNDDFHLAGALAIEIHVRKDICISIRIHQFHTVDELEVFAIDAQRLAAVDFFAGLLGETGNDGMAKGERLGGLRLVVTGTDNQFATVGGNAGRSGHADHAVADMLDVGDADSVGEDNLADIRETGAVDGHRLSGHHLRREEHLDAQPGGVRVDDFLRGTCRERAHQDHGQQYSEICKYLFHN